MMSQTRQLLKNIMDQCFIWKNVVPEYRDKFEDQIKSRIDVVDALVENYKDSERQRDLSIKFRWGHNHDFGTFFLAGQMGNRHIDILADFIDIFNLPLDLRGKKVLDIGVWTGGTSLLLAALGAEVTSLEEVVKYADTVNYLATSFGLSNLQCRSISLYDIDDNDVYDYVIYAGVIYHVTDPILSLRILFNSIKDDGKIFVETFGVNTDQHSSPIALVEGPKFFRGGSKAQLNRGGWNYFIPSGGALASWLDTVGFSNIIIGKIDAHSRIKACATRVSHVDVLRAGLSRPNIR